MFLSTKQAAINEPGQITIINGFALWGSFGLAVIYALSKPTTKIFRGVLWAALSAALFSVGVMVYQLSTVGELRYYYYKSLYTVLVLTGTILVSFFAGSLAKIIYSQPRKIALGFLAILTASSIGFAWAGATPQTNDYVREKPYGLSIEMADAISTIVKTRPQYLQNTFAIGSCNRVQDIKATQLIIALSGINNGTDAISSAQFFSPKEHDTFSEVAAYLKITKGKLIVISSDRAVEKALTSYLGSRAGRIEFVRLGDAASGVEKPVSACPERLQA